MEYADYDEVDALNDLNDELRVVIQTLMVLSAEMTEHEQRIADMLIQNSNEIRHKLNKESTQFSKHLMDETKKVLPPLVQEYDRIVSPVFDKVKQTHRTINFWIMGIIGVFIALGIMSWFLVWQYKNEFMRYKNSVEIVRAFNASDAAVCDGRICVKGEAGKGYQPYLRAKARE